MKWEESARVEMLEICPAKETVAGVMNSAATGKTTVNTEDRT
jgi:hypothetical protein